MTARRRPILPAAPEPNPDEHWTERASCGPETADLFIIAGKSRDWNHSRHADQRAEAAAICATCPVIETCLRDAIERDDWETFAGGKTPAQRKVVVQGEPARVQCRMDGCDRTFANAQARSRHETQGHSTHCRRGHQMVGDNVAVYSGARACRECYRQRCRDFRARRAEAS